MDFEDMHSIIKRNQLKNARFAREGANKFLI